MKTVKDVSAEFRRELEALYDKREIDSLSMLVLAENAGTSPAKIKAFPELEIPAKQAAIIDEVLIRLKTGEPIQYILGHTEFYSLQFMVNPSVLIPRPETEELVEWVISSVNSKQLAVGSGPQPNHILDIGTGSGCIAISLKKNLDDVQVSAMDISTEALQTAKENAELNNVSVNFIKADILNLTNHSPLTTPYSVIVSNPPYVTLEDKKQMHINVTDFEPHNALFVPDDDPLVFYKAIIDFATKNLKKNGLLFFEINESYGKQIVDLLNVKSFKNAELKKDMSDRFRMIKAVW
jgi:release factor glutamine methyltransferase